MVVYLMGKTLLSHVLHCQGLAVDDCTVALGNALLKRSEDPATGKIGVPATLAQLRVPHRNKEITAQN